MRRPLYYLNYIAAGSVTIFGFYNRDYLLGFAGIGMLILNYGYDYKSRDYNNIVKSISDLPTNKQVKEKAIKNSDVWSDNFEFTEREMLIYRNGFKDGAEFICTNLANNLLENSNGKK